LRRLYDVVVKLVGADLPLETRLQVARALTMTAWSTGQLGNHQNLGAELALLSSEHRAARLTCLTTVMFENSRGCLSACLGDYAHALEAFVMGYESAKMVGNEMFMGINAANAAVAVGRLGRYSEALSW